MADKQKDKTLEPGAPGVDIGARPALAPPSPASLADRSDDDWFEGRETATNDLPRYGIGDPTDPEVEHPDKVLVSFEGVYEDTSAEMISEKVRLVHRMKCRTLMGGHPRIEIWGNIGIDKVLPTLAPGTRIRLLYIGKIKVKGRKQPMKDIRVEFPADAKRRPNPFAPKAGAGAL